MSAVPASSSIALSAIDPLAIHVQQKDSGSGSSISVRIQPIMRDVLVHSGARIIHAFTSDRHFMRLSFVTLDFFTAGKACTRRSKRLQNAGTSFPGELRD